MRSISESNARGRKNRSYVANATIETVQAATANPKTDTRLGKVGR